MNTLQEISEKIPAMQDDIDALKAAFPAGDTAGHCRYHEELIERNAELRKLRIAIQEKTISGLVWAGIVCLFMWGKAELVKQFGQHI